METRLTTIDQTEAKMVNRNCMYISRVGYSKH